MRWKEIILWVSLCKNGPKISHLFFADNNLVFCRARVSDGGKNLGDIGKI